MRLKKKRIWQSIAPDKFTLLSGVLIVLSFPPWNFWPLIWICLVPWLSVIHQRKTPRECAIQGFWLSYFMSIGGFYWVAYVLQEFGNLPWSLSILGLQIFSFFGQPQFFAFATLFKFLDPHRLERSHRWNPLVILLFFSFLYVGLDWILPKLFLDTLGHAFYQAQNLRQIADIGGAFLLTFLVFLVNGSLEEMIRTKKWRNFRLPASVGLALFLVALSWTYGLFRKNQITTLITHAPQRLQAAAIQANIGDFDKVAAERGVTGAAAKIIDTFTEMTYEALSQNPRPEIIIWPETSYPSTFRNPHSLTELKLDTQIEKLVREIQVPLLFGGYDHARGKDFNAFFLLSPQGDLQTYHKSILLLFGEYIPGAETFSWIRETFPQVGNFGRGQGPDILTIQKTANSDAPPVLAGPMICYEGLFTPFSVLAAGKGAQFLMNITNDSWFGSWGEPQLHLALTIFRSIETRLPMLRSTNTGISALILPTGEITEETPINVQKIMNVSIPIVEQIPTLVKRWGDWFGLFALGASLTGILVSVSASKRKRLE